MSVGLGCGHARGDDLGRPAGRAIGRLPGPRLEPTIDRHGRALAQRLRGGLAVASQATMSRNCTIPLPPETGKRANANRPTRVDQMPYFAARLSTSAVRALASEGASRAATT